MKFQFFQIFVGASLLAVILSTCLLEFVNRGSGRSYQQIIATETTTKEPAPQRGDGRTED